MQSVVMPQRFTHTHFVQTFEWSWIMGLLVVISWRHLAHWSSTQGLGLWYHRMIVWFTPIIPIKSWNEGRFDQAHFQILSHECWCSLRLYPESYTVSDLHQWSPQCNLFPTRYLSRWHYHLLNIKSVRSDKVYGWC